MKRLTGSSLHNIIYNVMTSVTKHHVY